MALADVKKLVDSLSSARVLLPHGGHVLSVNVLFCGTLVLLVSCMCRGKKTTPTAKILEGTAAKVGPTFERVNLNKPPFSEKHAY